MVFEFKPKITKELLMKHQTEETFMEHYLGVHVKKGLSNSPFRSDDHPTCSFYRDKKGVLIYHDMSGDFHGDFVQVVQRFFNVTYKQALYIIANDFGIYKSDNNVNLPKIEYSNEVITESLPSVIQCTVREFHDHELEWWDKFGITRKTLKKFHIHAIEHVFLNSYILCSSSKNKYIFGYYFGKHNGLENWKIYFPLSDKDKNQNKFLGNTKAINGLTQLPKTGEVVVITKSLKDVACLYELGIPAISFQSENTILTESQYEKLKLRFKHVIVNYDWDRAGQRSMIQMRKLYNVKCLSFVKKDVYGKDISDFVSLHGKEKALLLINKLKEKYLNG